MDPPSIWEIAIITVILIPCMNLLNSLLIMKSFTLECKWPIVFIRYMYVILIPCMNRCGQCVSGCPVSMAGVEWREEVAVLL